MKLPRSTLRNVIISDFDETVTDRDTIAILAQLPYLCKPNLKPKWPHFADTYMINYEKFKKNPQIFGGEGGKRILPLLPQSHIKIDFSNYKSLFKSELRYQTDARLLELTSTGEITKYGIFSGIKHSQVQQYAEDNLKRQSFALRKGFRGCMSSITPDSFFIISVNWSAEFIQKSIGDNLVDLENIYCNQLLSHQGTYSGQFSNSILTGSDKVVVLEKILAENEKHKDNARYWYIGDSGTDLLGILHPDVNGVLLLDPEVQEEKFRKVASNVLGISQELTDQFINEKNCGWLQCYEKNNDNYVFLAKSWSDLSMHM